MGESSSIPPLNVITRKGCSVPPPIELATRFIRHTRLKRYGPSAVVVAAFALWLLSVFSVLPGNVVFWASALAMVVGELAGDLARGWRATGAVRVDEGGITLGGERIGREAMRFGYVVPATRWRGARVVIHSVRQVPLATVDADADAGARILSELGIGAAAFKEQSRNLSDPNLLRALVLLGSLAAGAWAHHALSPHGTLLAKAVAFAIVVAAVLGTIPTAVWRIVVARDGLFVEGMQRRFIPWSEVVSTRCSWGGVSLKLTNGALALPANGDQQPALLARIDEALAAYRADASVDLDTRLARRGRDRGAWLRALSGREGDFRSAPLSDEQLWSLIERTSTPATARAAAALILARSADENDRARLRITAEACASPRLRVVLDGAGRGVGEEALCQVLDEVEDEDEKAPVEVERALRQAGG
jgi:hypothetical protein